MTYDPDLEEKEPIEIFTEPKEVVLFEDDLTLRELYELTRWWEFLKEQDHPSVADFLNITYIFFEQAFKKAKVLSDPWRQGFCLYAIGSTARKEPGYHDIDFLLINNLITRDLGTIDPQDVLEKRFNYSLNHPIPEQYDRYRDLGERVIISLEDKSRPASRIHLTLQPEVRSEEKWEELDTQPKIVIYRNSTPQNIVRKPQDF